MVFTAIGAIGQVVSGDSGPLATNRDQYAVTLADDQGDDNNVLVSAFILVCPFH